MAIEWTKRVRNAETGREEWVDDGVTHEGLVMGPGSTREERVMSDVYANVTRVPVWDPVKGEPSEVATAYHFECGSRVGKATVDFDRTRPDYLAWIAQRDAAAKKYAAEKAAREAKEKEARDRAEALPLEKGSEVVVTSGRKVPKGTRGVIIWMGSGNYGPRVGLKDASGEVHWTAAGNVTTVVPGKDVGYVPPGGWEALVEARRKASMSHEAAMDAYLETVPRKGDRVTSLESGISGKVFWVKGSRLGFKARKGDDPIWANAWEVRKEDGTVCSKPPGWVDRKPKGKGTPAGGPKKAPAGFMDHGLGAPTASEPVVTPDPKLLAMPAPYCNIRSLEEREDGSWAALDASGAFLVSLPRSGADKIAALL